MELYRAACHQDLEATVAKYKWGGKRPAPTVSSWLKIKNPSYSQAAGRHEQFTRYRRFSLDPIPLSITHYAAGGD